MLTNTYKMMEFAVKTNIVDEVRAYMAEHHLTQTMISDATDISKSMLNHMLRENPTFEVSAGNGRTVAIADKYFNRLATYIGYSLQKEYWATKKTPELVQLLAELQEAKELGLTRIMIGSTGSGKTHVTQLFARKNPADTFVITIGSSDRLGDVLEKIIQKIKIPTGRTISKKIRDIIKFFTRLKNDGFSPQLIFDESEYMKQPVLASNKELYDHLNGICSVVLIGTEQLLDNIETLKKRNKPGMPQYYRRIKFGIRILPSIDKQFKLFLQDIQDKELCKFLRRICENYGELHDALVPVLRESDRTGEPISEELARRVLNLPKSLYD